LKIKICGIKSLEQATQAVELGADLLGFNFYPPSPRYLHPKDCKRLVTRLRRSIHASAKDVMLVGVFVNAPKAEILKVLEDCDLDIAQLSGDERRSSSKNLRSGVKSFARLPMMLRRLPAIPGAQRSLAWLVDASGAYGERVILPIGIAGYWRASRRPLAGGLNPRMSGRRHVRPCESTYSRGRIARGVWICTALAL
jgi:phosphoribosylanthranilate isomerase